MTKVVLVCMAGMSTNVMRGKIQKAADDANHDLSIVAVGLDSLDNALDGCNIVLLGPQIKYAEKSVRKVIDKVDVNIPHMVIDSTDFGMMRGDLVYEKMQIVLKK